jgi:hypothetical protein
MAAFCVRTDLPLGTALSLFDGQVISAKIWISNCGVIQIGEVRFDVCEGVKVEFVPVNMPLEPGEELLMEMKVMICAPVQEISILVVCDTCNYDFHSVKRTVQPITVEKVVSITSIRAMTVMPEDFDAAENSSDLVFMVCYISNHSEHLFSYEASFRKSALELSCVLCKERKTGLLTPFQTTAFILAVEKAAIESSFGNEDRLRVMNAVKAQEERCQGRISKAQRMDLTERIAISSFVEEHLKFEWTYGYGKRGMVMGSGCLADPSILLELRRKRPKLNVRIEELEVVRCSVSLEKFGDAAFGVLWGEQLEERCPEGKREFSFQFLFTKSGEIEFDVRYVIIEGVKGKRTVSAMVVEDASVFHINLLC